MSQLAGELGVQLPARSSADLFGHGDVVELTALQPGDLLFWSTRGRKIGHVGMWLGDGTFVHSSAQVGVEIRSFDDPWWRPRFRGARRLLAIRNALIAP